jgi:hypothetical protein
MATLMLADFSVRLACGLAILLLLTPWRVVPPAFFRTHGLVILGLLVLAALDLSRAQGGRISTPTVAVIAAAVLAFAVSVLWGLGVPRLAVPLTTSLVLLSGGWLVAASRVPRWDLWTLGAAGRLASAFLLGATLTAMLLGHHYLTAPSMSIEPLKRHVRCIGWGLAARMILAGLGCWLWYSGRAGVHSSGQVSGFFLAIRWGMGFAAPLLATWMTWETVAIRSTQSATGILYIATTLVLFGELTALILSRDVGILL